MSCGVGRRRGLDPVLLWLWRRLVATAPIGSLAWEPPYAAGAAQEMAKRQKEILYDITYMQNLKNTKKKKEKENTATGNKNPTNGKTHQ